MCALPIFNVVTILMFRGTFTALVTPFRESAIDFTALRI
jgi:dihydrodipicolinate synthase/N-acetylneuraminate lyase